MLEKFGTTLLFVFFLFVLLVGMNMLMKVIYPYTSKVSASLADTLTI